MSWPWPESVHSRLHADKLFPRPHLAGGWTLSCHHKQQGILLDTSELQQKIFHINKPATWVAIAEVHVPPNALGLQYTRPPFRVHRTTSFKHCLLFVALLPAASFCLDHTKTSNHHWIKPLSARRVFSQMDTSSVPRRMCNGPQGHVVLRRAVINRIESTGWSLHGCAARLLPRRKISVKLGEVRFLRFPWPLQAIWTKPDIHSEADISVAFLF